MRPPIYGWLYLNFGNCVLADDLKQYKGKRCLTHHLVGAVGTRSPTTETGVVRQTALAFVLLQVIDKNAVAEDEIKPTLIMLGFARETRTRALKRS